MSTKTEQIQSDERKFVAKCDLIKHIGTCATIALLVWHAIDMLTAALQSNPATLNAFAKCLKEWNIPNVILGICTVVCSGGWVITYKRTNYLSRKNGELRHKLERLDAVHTRSGLDEIGATPKEQKRNPK